jgi:hypothetical protein
VSSLCERHGKSFSTSDLRVSHTLDRNDSLYCDLITSSSVKVSSYLDNDVCLMNVCLIRQTMSDISLDHIIGNELKNSGITEGKFQEGWSFIGSSQIFVRKRTVLEIQCCELFHPLISNLMRFLLCRVFRSEMPIVVRIPLNQIGNDWFHLVIISLFYMRTFHGSFLHPVLMKKRPKCWPYDILAYIRIVDWINSTKLGWAKPSLWPCMTLLPMYRFHSTWAPMGQ